MDPDPGGLKTCGSCGSPILSLTFFYSETSRQKDKNVANVDKKKVIQKESHTNKVTKKRAYPAKMDVWYSCSARQFRSVGEKASMASLVVSKRLILMTIKYSCTKTKKRITLCTPPPRNHLGPLARWPSANTESQRGDTVTLIYSFPSISCLFMVYCSSIIIVEASADAVGERVVGGMTAFKFRAEPPLHYTVWRPVLFFCIF
jgi:hypothetical protein